MSKLRFEVLPDGLERILKDIQSRPAFNNFYLAGGTALALQIRHRRSVDLDFFSPRTFPTTILQELHCNYDTISLFNNSIEILIENNKIFFLNFAFPLRYPLINEEGLRLADPVDIGLFKLLELQGRTTRKDIIDLFFIDREIIQLEELLDLFESFYPKESFNSYSSLKSLINPVDIEKEPMPHTLMDINWQEANELISSKISKHIHKLIQ